ncbi:MAG: AraC family transcriptional regulator N-terminal domain-containing protein [Bdellovibrionia bacterium]
MKNARSRGSSKQSSVLTSVLTDIQKIVRVLAQETGRNETSIPFLSIIRFDGPNSLNQGVLKPSFCVIAQGRKEVHLGNEITHYGPGEYLISTLDIPAAGQVIGASKSSPYLGIRVELDPKEIASIALETEEAGVQLSMSENPSQGAFVGKIDAETLEAVLRVLKLLKLPEDAKFLAGAIKREIIYRLLKSEFGPQIYQNVLQHQQDLGIGKALRWLKENFHRPLHIENLAKASNMSVSSLHHKFKAVTNMGPLQYQKQLRLQEARRLLLTGAVDASTAAFQVGYESQSQFSREYRRLFGAPPIQDIRRLRLSGHTEILQD